MAREPRSCRGPLSKSRPVARGQLSTSAVRLQGTKNRFVPPVPEVCVFLLPESEFLKGLHPNALQSPSSTPRTGGKGPLTRACLPRQRALCVKKAGPVSFHSLFPDLSSSFPAREAGGAFQRCPLEQNHQHSPHRVEEVGSEAMRDSGILRGAWSPPWLSQLGQLEEAGGREAPRPGSSLSFSASCLLGFCQGP